MPSIPTRFCTVDDVKHVANIASDMQIDAVQDAAGVEDAIRSVSVTIMQLTRREWHFDHRVEVQPIPDSPIRGTFRVWPRAQPLSDDPRGPRVGITSTVSAPASWLGANDFRVLYNANKIEIYANLFSRISSGGFIVIDYYGGFKPLDEDHDVFDAHVALRRGCAIQSAFMYSRMINGMIGVKSKQTKTSRIEYSAMANGFIPEAHQLIAPYVRPLTGG